MTTATAPVQLLTVEAGGRLRVLRQCVAALCERLPDALPSCPDHGFRWQLGQPMLWIALETDAPTADTIVAAEQLLDELMSRHPWEEQPLLDWTGPDGPRRTRVQIEARPAAVATPAATAAAGTALGRALHALLLQDGARIKDAALQAIHAALVRFPALRCNDARLLELVQPALHDPVAGRLAALEAAPVWCEGALSAALLDALGACDAAYGTCLLDTMINRLGLRPDEGAYLRLIAQALSKTSGRTHEPALD